MIMEKRRLLFTILSISLLTVMAGAAIAPALGIINKHFAGQDPLLIQLVVSLPALFIIGLEVGSSNAGRRRPTLPEGEVITCATRPARGIFA